MQNDKSPQIVFWIIWASILIGLFILQMFVGGGIPAGESSEGLSIIWLTITFGGAIASTVYRWTVFPKIKGPELLTMMIVGIAGAEFTGIAGMFFVESGFPTEKRLAFIVSVMAIFQYIPFYAPKANKSEEESRVKPHYKQ